MFLSIKYLLQAGSSVHFFFPLGNFFSNSNFFPLLSLWQNSFSSCFTKVHRRFPWTLFFLSSKLPLVFHLFHIILLYLLLTVPLCLSTNCPQTFHVPPDTPKHSIAPSCISHTSLPLPLYPLFALELTHILLWFSKNSTLFHYYLTASLPSPHTHTFFAPLISSIPLWLPICFYATVKTQTHRHSNLWWASGMTCYDKHI